MTWKIDYMRDASDSMDLRYAVVPAETAAVSRFLFFLNGRTEWIEKYAYVPLDLQLDDRTGFITMDHRGQGASGGARAFVDSYDTYARDCGAVLSQVAGNKPHILMAHSMGCLIGLYATLRGIISPEALVLCSPLFGLPNWPVPRLLARPTSKWLSMARLGAMHTGAGNHSKDRFEYNQLTHDIDKFNIIKRSPYPVPSASFGWVSATFAALDYVFDPENLKKLRVPVLVLVGGNETVVEPRGFQSWIKAASAATNAEIEFAMIPEAKHELLSEIPKYYDQATERIRNFIRKI